MSPPWHLQFLWSNGERQDNLVKKGPKCNLFNVVHFLRYYGLCKRKVNGNSAICISSNCVTLGNTELLRSAGNGDGKKTLSLVDASVTLAKGNSQLCVFVNVWKLQLSKRGSLMSVCLYALCLSIESERNEFIYFLENESYF